MTDAEVEAVAAALWGFGSRSWGNMVRINDPWNKSLIIQVRETARAAIAALDGVRGKPTHRHVRRGTIYTKVGEAEVQAKNWRVTEGDVLVIYRSADGKLWGRPKPEFEDGRFIPLPPAPEDAP